MEDFSATGEKTRIEPFKLKISEDHFIMVSYETIPGNMKRCPYTYLSAQLAKRMQNGR